MDFNKNVIFNNDIDITENVVMKRKNYLDEGLLINDKLEAAPELHHRFKII